MWTHTPALGSPRTVPSSARILAWHLEYPPRARRWESVTWSTFQSKRNSAGLRWHPRPPRPTKIAGWVTPVRECKIVAVSSRAAEWVSHGLHPVRADGPQGVAALPRHNVDGQFRLEGLGARRRRFDSHPAARPRPRHHLLRHGRLVFDRPQRGGRRQEPAQDERTRAAGARDQGLLPDERRPERSWPVTQAHRDRDRPVAGADGYRLRRPLRDPCIRCG